MRSPRHPSIPRSWVRHPPFQAPISRAQHISRDGWIAAFPQRDPSLRVNTFDHAGNRRRSR